MAIYDPKTGLPLLIKQPGEVRNFFMDFGKVLDTGETISSIVSVVAISLGDVIGSAALTVAGYSIVGDGVQIEFRDGTHRERYRVEVQVITSSADTIEGEGILLVKEM